MGTPFFFWSVPPSHRPGSKNVKPDALSHVLDFPRSKLLPDNCAWGCCGGCSVLGGIERQVREALRGVAVTVRCPDGLFVPKPLRAAVLEWSHSSRLVCHPGLLRTLASFRQRFGGPPWTKMPDSLWRPAWFVPRINLLISLLLVCCSLCPFPPTPGLTFHLILLLASLFLKATPLY